MVASAILHTIAVTLAIGFTLLCELRFFIFHKAVIDLLRTVGCFWHQHKGCTDGRVPKSRENYWKTKLLRNVDRDRRNTSKLRRRGWKVMKVWECDTADTNGLLSRLVRFLGPPSA